MRNTDGRRPSGATSGRRGPVRGPKFKGIRFGLGIANFILAFALLIHSFIIGLFKEGAGLGAAGLFPVILLIVAGIMAVKMQYKAAPIAFIAPAFFDFLADITCLVHAGKAWKVYGFIIMILALVFLGLCCLRMGRNIFAPAVLMGIVVVVSLVVMLIAGFVAKRAAKKEKTDDKAVEESAENTEAAQQPAEPEVDPLEGVTVIQEAEPAKEGSLYLSTENFTINYTNYEIGTDDNGDMCICIYYDFTNNGSEAKNVPSLSYIKVMQNGAECGKASIETPNEQMENYKNQVEPGATVNICQVFTIQDMSPVEVSAVEFIPTDARSAVMTLTLSE